MKFSMSVIPVLVQSLLVDITTGKPYTYDDVEAFDTGSKAELRHQQVSYTLDRLTDMSVADVRRFDFELDSKEDVPEEDEVLELQRPITYTSPGVRPMQFGDLSGMRPKKKNLSKKKLLKKMGGDFNPDWMSLEEPHSKYVVHKKDMEMDDVSEQLLNLNRALDFKELEGMDMKVVTTFQEWLLKMATCNVTYVWTDLGEFFWPRYLKIGQCGILNDTNISSNEKGQEEQRQYLSNRPQLSERGCSWPEGMKCVQADSQVFHILRWHCRAKSQNFIKDLNEHTNHGKQRKCRWYKVPYPVTLSCKCSCKK